MWGAKSFAHRPTCKDFQSLQLAAVPSTDDVCRFWKLSLYSECYDSWTFGCRLRVHLRAFTNGDIFVQCILFLSIIPHGRCSESSGVETQSICFMHRRVNKSFGSKPAHRYLFLSHFYVVCGSVRISQCCCCCCCQPACHRQWWNVSFSCTSHGIVLASALLNNTRCNYCLLFSLISLIRVRIWRGVALQEQQQQQQQQPPPSPTQRNDVEDVIVIVHGCILPSHYVKRRRNLRSHAGLGLP